MIIGSDSLHRLLVDEDWLDVELPAVVSNQPCEVALQGLVLVGIDDVDFDAALPPSFRATTEDERVI